MRLLSYNFNNLISFVTLANTKLRLPEDDADDADASQHVGLFINIIDFYICCAFVGMDNKIPIYASCTLGSLGSEYLHPDYYYYYYYYYYYWNKVFFNLFYFNKYTRRYFFLLFFGTCFLLWFVIECIFYVSCAVSVIDSVVVVPEV